MANQASPSPKKVLVSAIAAAVGVILLTSLFGSCAVISPGNVGVVFNRWTGSLASHGQGIVWKMPFVTDVQSYPTALRTYTMVSKTEEGSAKGDDSIDLPTAEGQHIKQDLSVTYNTSEEKAAEVFRAFRGADVSEIENTFIRRTIITVAQNIAGQMLLSDVISSKRGELQVNIQKILSGELFKMGFILDKVNLGASHLPASLEQQMQRKMAAQQESQQAEYEQKKQEGLARAAVATANGQAQSTLINAKAQAESNHLLQSSITPTLVEYRKIEKWDGKLPTVSGGGTPLINIK